MIFTLHHAKGTLMLSAEDRDQAIAWSRRQLGSRGGLVSITDHVSMDEDRSVERDGTGISAVEAEGCHPIVNRIETSAQDVAEEQGRSRFFDPHLGQWPWRLKKQVRH